MIRLRYQSDALLLPVRVTPKSYQDALLPYTEGDESLRCAVRSAPEDGKANLAVLRLLAKTLKLPKSSLEVARGTQARDKQVLCQNISHQDLASVLQRIASALGQGDTEQCLALVT